MTKTREKKNRKKKERDRMENHCEHDILILTISSWGIIGIEYKVLSKNLKQII